MTDYRDFEDPSRSGRHARPGEAARARPASLRSRVTGERECGVLAEPRGERPAAGAVNAGGIPAQGAPGARKPSVPKAWLIGLAGLLLILAGVSAYSLVKLSSVQASLQRPVSSEKPELSAEQQQSRMKMR